MEGAACVLSRWLSHRPARSLLDLGCGRGRWLKAARQCQLDDLAGVDGLPLPAADLVCPPACFRVHDLRAPLDLGRRFDLALCLEVAEHLEPEHAPTLVHSLARHADAILFSAAAPGQAGQHHVNCQWPAWWQALFNAAGYACDDWLRWAVWRDARVEPWYRQNLFVALRHPAAAGREDRLLPVIHPDLQRRGEFLARRAERAATLARVANGEFPLAWTLAAPLRGLWRKAARRWP